LAGFAIENVTKLSFASVRMQAAERAHNFVVDLSLQTTSTVVEVLRCRSSFRSPPSRLMHGRWRRWDVEQSPFTVVDTGLCGRRRPPLLSKAPRTSSYLLTDWNDLLVDSQSLFSYSVEQITVLHKYLPPLMWFLSQLLLKACFKKLPYSRDLP